MKKLLLHTFSILLIALYLPYPIHSSEEDVLHRILSISPIQPGGELRALWVVRNALVSAESIDRVIDLAIRGRFQLLFVQVRGRGEAYYRSSIEPAASDLEASPDEFDPLDYLLARAHGAGIQVHAWVNVFYVWSDNDEAPPPAHVVRLHPEWLSVDWRRRRMDELGLEECKRLGAEGYFLSPSVREVRVYTASIIAEVASRYGVDGIHLDYVRYPGAMFGFSVEERTRFMLEHGADPLDLVSRRGRITGIIGEIGAMSLDALWTRWRAAQVDSMVIAVRAAAQGLPLSAAVVADYGDALSKKGQDWIGWVQKGYVDFVVPMAYGMDPVQIEELAGYLEKVIGNDRFIVGLGLFDGRARYLEASVEALRRAGVMGYSLFSHNQLVDQPYAIKFLHEVFFRGLE